jgi:CSLREA domain-containing protein
VSIRSFKRAHARRLTREHQKLSNVKRRGTLAASAALSASALFAANAQAANYVVNSTADDASGGTCQPSPGTCTLRDAISSANGDTTSDTITFDPTLSGPITLTGANGPLSITHSGGLAIDGPTSGTQEVSGGDQTQVFNITAPSGNDVSLSHLKVSHGSTPNEGGAIFSGSGSPNSQGPNLTLTGDIVTDSNSTSNDGGGIYVDGPLDLSGTTISGNTAADVGGGVYVDKYNENFADVTITNSTITGNSAASAGGMQSAKYSSIENSHITDNHATSGSGGGIQTRGFHTVVTGSDVTGNTATDGGAGIAANTKYGTTISGSTLSGNSVSGNAAIGGGLEVNAEAAGPGPLSGYLKYNPTQVTDTTISGNTGAGGAGIGAMYVAPGSPITVRSSTISNNQGGRNSAGGGIFLISEIDSPVHVVDSTLTGNSADQGGGVSVGYGGSRYVFGGNNGSLAIDNSTIASNNATQSGQSGGIYLGEYSSGPNAPEHSPVIALNSTIVSGNKAAGSPQDLARGSGSTDGGFNSAFSLIQTPGTVPFLNKKATLTGVNPQLGALANNGGPTKTMALAGTSPAIDQGHADTGLTNDQRGSAHPRTLDSTLVINPRGGDGTDIGAFELRERSVAGAGFSAKIGGKSLGGSNKPTVSGGTSVLCGVKVGSLSSCQVNVRSSSGAVLAKGTAKGSATASSVTVNVKLTAAGQKALKNHSKGLTEQAWVKGNTSRSGTKTVGGKVHLTS